jgi:hypothetical protein
VVEDCALHGADLVDLDLEAVEDGSFLTRPIEQDKLFAYLDELRGRGCALAAVTRRKLT